MGKKKQAEGRESLDQRGSTGADQSPVVEHESAAADGLGDLAREVESFLARREELARKLAEEIDATERRLADLKRTAATLFPADSPPTSSTKERRSKTAPASKSAKRKAEPATNNEVAAPASPAASTEGRPIEGEAPYEPHLD